MIAIPSRHKSLTLLATVVVAQVLLLAVQIKRAGQVRLIRVWAVELISPVQRASSWVVYNFEHGWATTSACAIPGRTIRPCAPNWTD